MIWWAKAGNLLWPAGQLLLSLALAGAIGWQRETRDQAAGFRTHILVSLGATLVTLVSQSYTRDVPGRITANVVVGVGFLGAGAIMRQEGSVRGLTTAATLWVCACIGIAVGRGGLFTALAIVCAALVLAILTFLRQVERRWIHPMPIRVLTITYQARPEKRREMITLLGRQRCEVQRVHRDEVHRDGPGTLSLEVRLPRDPHFLEISDHLLALDGVQSVIWE